MMKILQMGFTPNYGGVESCIINYFRKLQSDEIQFGFVNIWGSPIAFQDEIINRGGKVHNITEWDEHRYRAMKQLKNIINENHYDVVHFNVNSIKNILPFWAAQTSLSKGWCVHFHSGIVPEDIIGKSLRWVNSYWINNNANAMMSCSAIATQSTFGRKPKLDVTMIKNAIDVKKYNFNPTVREKLDKKYAIGKKYVIGHVGRFMHEKNHEFLIDIFDAFHKKHADSVLLLVGDGQLKDKIQQKVRKLKLEDSVIFTGMVQDSSAYYQMMDLFLLPSFSEGLPVVSIEAQAAGLPCIVADTITREMKMSDNMTYVSLENGTDLWVTEMERYYQMQKKHFDNNKLIDKFGFNIDTQADTLKKIYMRIGR